MDTKHFMMAGFASAALLFAAPAGAQIGVDLGGVDLDTDVDVEADVGADVRTDARAGDPYEYRGYRSGRWYPYEEHRRAGYYDERYGGYDCYRAFQYGWENGYRTRYESHWCYDDRGREYEVRGARVAVRID